MIRFALLVMLGIGLTSCWPTVFLKPRDASFPEEWKRFFVSPLEITSATAPSNYPAVLSESLRTGLQNNTSLKLGSKLEDAQVQISGIVTNYNTSPVAVQSGDQASKNRLTIGVNFTIITPTKGLEKITLNSSRYSDYSSSEQLVDVENRLIEEINQQIVQDVINKLLSNW